MFCVCTISPKATKGQLCYERTHSIYRHVLRALYIRRFCKQRFGFCLIMLLPNRDVYPAFELLSRTNLPATDRFLFVCTSSIRFSQFDQLIEGLRFYFLLMSSPFTVDALSWYPKLPTEAIIAASSFTITMTVWSNRTTVSSEWARIRSKFMNCWEVPWCLFDLMQSKLKGYVR